MAFFPKIQSHCPYKSERPAAMDGDICRICNHRVIDLTDWSDAERIAFAAGQTEDVCISYRLPLRPALAAAALAAALPAVAATQGGASPAQAPAPAASPAAPAPAATADDDHRIEFVGVASRIRRPDGPTAAQLGVASDLVTIAEAPADPADGNSAEKPLPSSGPND